jgi:hypothetical protein
MTFEHPMRHRLGVIFFCLIALLTAREGQNFYMPRPRMVDPKVVSAPVRESSNFAFEDPLTAEVILRSFCSLEGNADLPCCAVISVHVELSSLELELNPEAFPQAWDFVPEAKSSMGNATLIPEYLQQTDREPLARDIWNYPAGWWPLSLQQCNNVKKDKHGEEYCAPDEKAVVPEPQSFLLLITGFLVPTLYHLRRQKYLRRQTTPATHNRITKSCSITPSFSPFAR